MSCLLRLFGSETKHAKFAKTCQAHFCSSILGISVAKVLGAGEVPVWLREGRRFLCGGGCPGHCTDVPRPELASAAIQKCLDGGGHLHCLCSSSTICRFSIRPYAFGGRTYDVDEAPCTSSLVGEKGREDSSQSGRSAARLQTPHLLVKQGVDPTRTLEQSVILQSVLGMISH